MEQKYTAIWQSESPLEREWVQEIFGPYLASDITDGRYEVALDNCILFDAFVYCHDPKYYARFRGKNAFLVHFFDENYEGGYEIYENFRGVIRCFWSSVFNQSHVMSMPLGYAAGTKRAAPFEPASQRKYLWSFIGHLEKSSRPDMVKALSRLEPHFLFATDGIRGIPAFPARRAMYSSEYSEVLAQSAFSPCPMGNVNLESFRIYEALECGSIPIVERRMTLDYFANLLGDHPIPTVRSWFEAQRLICRMIENPDEIDAVQDRCSKWWNDYKRRYSESVGRFLADHSQKSDSLLPKRVVSNIQNLPLWRTMEILRHHDFRAIRRRLGRQAKRLLTNGSWRVAHRPDAPLEETRKFRG